MSEAQKKANIKYESKRQIKKVSFNADTEKDLLEFANSVDFSNWVKQKIKESTPCVSNKPVESKNA